MGRARDTLWVEGGHQGRRFCTARGRKEALRWVLQGRIGVRVGTGVREGLSQRGKEDFPLPRGGREAMREIAYGSLGVEAGNWRWFLSGVPDGRR